MKNQILGLLSDFGTKDGYVAAMKGVIYEISSAITIVDISHDIDKQDVRHGAFVLATAAPFFPDETVFVCVVDPGVGTIRKGIVVEGKEHLYVGPDNGILMLAAEHEGIQHVYEITNRKYMRHEISATFHGRDIFAPVAAYLATGTCPEEIGKEIFDYIVLSWTKVEIKNKKISGGVLHVDGFGNIITNITLDDLKQEGIEFGDVLNVQIKEQVNKIAFYETYGKTQPGEFLGLIGSTGFFELAINQSNAAHKLDVSTGDIITISRNMLSP
ncbi:S-adenosyl-l-methionine hydroxide adenosyltransferase family protein [Candidatus Borrarchaeum sp.]|uniref:SAM hydrolase/SAM-dependent halogenase family protein n=1 Tax=Candidatus Borrarchaeum sp. TaxID=2846742 RepID=UPI00257B4E43|nr:S-adenosyl-l-methionine hydroxide adenosyltransferase family protein [Candidatus Borrarchaeum sp.]